LASAQGWLTASTVRQSGI